MSELTPESVPEEQTGERPTITIGLPSGWARAALAGMCAVAIGWFLPVVVASLGFWSVADNPWLKDYTWQEAIKTGGGFWALSLGVPAALGNITVTAVPLLWTLAQVSLVRLLLQSVRNFAAESAWAAVPSAALTALVIQASAIPEAAWWKVMLGAVVVCASGALWAVLVLSPAYPAWMARLNNVWVGLRIGAVWFAALAAIGLVAAAMATWNSREAMAAVAAGLGATGGNKTVLDLVQVGFVPLAMAWALSWLLGPGFVGVSGEVITRANPASVALPLPIWQLIPAEATEIPIWPFVLLAVALGLGAWWWLRRMAPVSAAVGAGAAACFMLMLVAGWMALSSLSLGENQLKWLGVPIVAVVCRIALVVVLPAIVVNLALHPLTVTTVRSLVMKAVGWGKTKIASWKQKETAPDVKD